MLFSVVRLILKFHLFVLMDILLMEEGVVNAQRFVKHAEALVFALHAYLAILCLIKLHQVFV
jgi:hypothetical protein